MGDAEFEVLKYELKADLNAYLAATDPAKVKTRTLAEVIAFNKSDARELGLFGQEIFDDAEKLGPLTDPAYLAARAKSLALAKVGLDTMLSANNVAALVEPTYGLHVAPAIPSAAIISMAPRPANSRHLRLSAPDCADGAGEGVARRDQLHRQGKQRRRPAALRLRPRTGGEDAGAAAISAQRSHGGLLESAGK